MADDTFLPQQEDLFAAGPEQFNPVDIILGRIGANVSSGATGTGVTGSAAWITSLQTNTPSYSFGGVISEIIVFDRKLQEEERQQVYGYLSRKYNLDSKLPDSYYLSHPSTSELGLTYWQIAHHPNSKDLSTISDGSEFAGINVTDFFNMPELIYKSKDTVLSSGIALGGDTYGYLGVTFA